MSTSMISRRNLLALIGAGIAAPAFAATGLSLTEAQLQAGVQFLTRHPSVDVHAHPGRFFLRDIPRTDATERLGAPAEAQVLTDMAAGRITAALFNCVSDASLLGFTAAGGLAPVREFQPGEAWGEYQRQIGLLKALAAKGEVVRGLNRADIGKALKARKTAAVFAVEGGDFIEDRLDRVHQAHADGVRSITIVHYHPNQIGDPQTEPPRTPGLTATGKRIVREMNRTGIVVDLAHASYGVTKDAVAVSDRPMMISHTNLKRTDLDHPRLVTPEHARLVTSHGGIIGSVPSGIGQASVGDWIASILRLIDTVGVDHVAIGTDMDANYRPVFTDYRDWGVIPAALLARGLSEAETAKVMGGNFLRIFPG
jgi:membrane dipeptidase